MLENAKTAEKLDALTPKQIVAELDKYIVGQANAKRAVAVALRNRIRRLKLEAEIREDVTPKNILMIGPTGVGKTEIARRLARLAGSPFLKVEATKYTEVGYVGRDVESMVRDLMAAGFQMVKLEMQESVKLEAEKRAEDRILDLLLPGSGKKKKEKPPTPKPVVRPVSSFSISNDNGSNVMGTAIQVGIPIMRKKKAAADEIVEEKKELSEEERAAEEAEKAKYESTREKFRSMLKAGQFENKTVELEVNQEVQFPALGMLGSGFEEFENGLSGLAGMLGGNKKKKVLNVKRARELLINEEAEKLIDQDRVTDEARNRVQQMGIIFIDEIDKIAVKGQSGGHDVSREGVQRDILPIVEGATVNTKWGPVDTSHVLFIGAGAFSISKPSDLIPELQGRFPLRVELESLGKDDFLRILTEPKNSLTRQYTDLLHTEGVDIEFTPESVRRLAEIAADVNSRLENIGARRLHTIMETLLENISFDAPDIAPVKITIAPEFVDERLKDIAEDQDLGRYIL